MKVSRSAPTGARVHQRAVTRLQQLCAAIRSRNYPNKAELARVMELDRRTIQRDLKVLREVHNAPLAFDRERNGFYFRDPKWKLSPLVLTEGELLSFFIAERMLRRLSEATEVQLVRGALARLAALLPQEVSVDLEALEQAVSFAPEPAADVSPEVLRKLTEAATQRETLWIEYFSPWNNEYTRREVNVLLVYNWIGEWYAISWDIEKQAYRDFHAARIVRMARTRRHFELPSDWHPQEYLKKGFGMFRGGKDVTVEIEFDAFQARYARERKFHETEKRMQLRDGRLRISFETTEAALEQVTRWLMQYGEHAMALRPAKLRGMMRERLQKTMKLYGLTENMR